MTTFLHNTCNVIDHDVFLSECKNTWDDVQCTGWARDQECMKNSVWMHRNCQKACTKCTPDGSTTDRQNEQTTTQPRITTPGTLLRKKLA
ncbi:hypothetical protein DPMN_132818 [Dreissena polymorpha]|uniref:ShKT domain-containing protein n=1 Tax=Dreissena polymorpha TaxID=45954 RepID=A0A9D4J982_DREPO|nr:hypothetical protein DPMN_132818 [Dreissena polymorpha]